MKIKHIEILKNRGIESTSSRTTINLLELKKYLTSNNDTTSSKLIEDSINRHRKTDSIAISYFYDATKNSDCFELGTFYLIKKNGEYLLLDGFRRLYIYDNHPNIDVDVIIYDYDSFKKGKEKEELFKLLFMLNNHKNSYTGGFSRTLFDNGFNLIFYKLYGIVLNDIMDLFQSYFMGVDKIYDSKPLAGSFIPKVMFKEIILQENLSFVDDLYLFNELVNINPGYSKATIFASELRKLRLDGTIDNDKIFNYLTFKDEIDSLYSIDVEESLPKIAYTAIGLKHNNIISDILMNILKNEVGIEVDKPITYYINEYKKLDIEYKKYPKVSNLGYKYSNYSTHLEGYHTVNKLLKANGDKKIIFRLILNPKTNEGLTPIKDLHYIDIITTEILDDSNMFRGSSHFILEVLTDNILIKENGLIKNRIVKNNTISKNNITLYRGDEVCDYKYKTIILENTESQIKRSQICNN